MTRSHTLISNNNMIHHYKAQTPNTAAENIHHRVLPWLSNRSRAPETAFDDVDAGLEPVRVAELVIVPVPFLSPPVELGSAVFVGVTTLPYGTVDVNPTAASAETIDEFVQDPIGAALPSTKLIAAHF